MNTSKEINSWYAKSRRTLPWRENKSPYSVWLSEIILQQTRVAQGLNYYIKFLEKFPTVNDLANAPQEDVLKTWEGLGYYSRARNLQKAAKLVVEELNGEFPKTAQELKRLPGIGDYTSAAIASICYEETIPAVDGNVIRVISRIFDVEDNPYDAKGKRLFFELGQELLNGHLPSDHNQAMMEFGALICTPSPKCDECMITDNCLARQNNTIEKRPFKKPKVKVLKRDLHYVVHQKNESIAIQLRTGNDIWKGLYELPLHEERPSYGSSQLIAGPVKHKLSHRDLNVYLWKSSNHQDLKPSVKWVKIADLEQHGFPIVLKRLIRDYVLPLTLQ